MIAAAGASRFPWPRVLALGLLRLDPEHFWALTLPEFRLLFAMPEGERLSRRDLERLIRQFPDPQNPDPHKQGAVR